MNIELVIETERRMKYRIKEREEIYGDEIVKLSRIKYGLWDNLLRPKEVMLLNVFDLWKVRWEEVYIRNVDSQHHQ